MKPLVTCKSEGGYYTPDRSEDAPIRIYADGTIQDDYYSLITGEDLRQRLSPEELLEVICAAHRNVAEGRVDG